MFSFWVMSKNLASLSNPSDRIRSLSKRLIPICWVAIFFIIAGVVLAGVKLKSHESTFSLYEGVIGSMIISATFWIALTLLIIRFLKSCERDGVFSQSGATSIRWIGLLILGQAILSLMTKSGALSYQYATGSSQLAFLIPSTTSSITKIILGLFLLIIARIITVGMSLEKDAELTI